MSSPARRPGSPRRDSDKPTMRITSAGGLTIFHGIGEVGMPHWPQDQPFPRGLYRGNGPTAAVPSRAVTV